MATFHYIPEDVCATDIYVDLDGDKIGTVKFVNGCDGNHAGICSLIKGQDIDWAVERLQGVRCGSSYTSCPDQLADALIAAREAKNAKDKSEED